MGALALRSGFLWIAYFATRFNKLVPLAEFENHLDLLLERERSQRASVRLTLLDKLGNVRVLFHGLNLYSLSCHFFARPCRLKTAWSRRTLTAPCSKNMLIRK